MLCLHDIVRASLIYVNHELSFLEHTGAVSSSAPKPNDLLQIDDSDTVTHPGSLCKFSVAGW